MLGYCRDTTRRVIHKYTFKRHVQSGPTPAATLCGIGCDWHTRVTEAEWDDPPEGYERCRICARKA